MNEALKESLVSLRAELVRLRRIYWEARFDHDFRTRRRDFSAQTRFVNAQSRLVYLVPWYRALKAAVQPLGSGCDAGSRLYRKKYEALVYLIREMLQFQSEHTRTRYFGDGIEAMTLPVPAEGGLNTWKVCKIGDIIQDVVQTLSAERKELLRRQTRAVDARKAFLDSLTADQRNLLSIALEAAKAKGSYAVSFDARDLC